MSLVYVFAASKQEGQPNVLFCSYFPLVQHDGRLMTAQANSEDALMLTLLRPIPAYLAAEQAEDAEHLSLCIAEDGLLHDEGRTIAAATRSCGGNKRRMRTTSTRCSRSVRISGEMR